MMETLETVTTTMQTHRQSDTDRFKEKGIFYPRGGSEWMRRIFKISPFINSSGDVIREGAKPSLKRAYQRLRIELIQ